MAVLHSIRRPSSARSKPAPQSGRKKTNRDIYGTERWKRLSAMFRRANPFCKHCLERGDMIDCSPGTKRGVVDHIVPINKGADPWDQANWQTLCTKCHAAKSAQDK